MPERRYIELYIINDTSCRIAEQSHIRGEFTPEGSVFYGRELNLESCNTPVADYYVGDLDMVFMRGNSTYCDEDTLEFDSSEDLDLFIRAVNEYNICYGSALISTPKPEKACVNCKGAVVCKECMKNAKEVIDF